MQKLGFLTMALAVALSAAVAGAQPFKMPRTLCE